jgi:hypothetical protein
VHIVEAGGRHFLLHLLCEDTRAELAHFIRCRSSNRQVYSRGREQIARQSDQH